jgi:hypothetical protein
MPNSGCALTTTKPGSGECRPAFIHPCVRPHFAMNRRTRATLHDYHLDGDEVNADSGRGGGTAVKSCAILRPELSETDSTYWMPSAAIDARASSWTRP